VLPAWVIGIVFIFGSIIGSFLNALIYRLPRNISLLNPSKSICPKCKHTLGALDLIPILSWCIQGGNCRYCKAHISPRYLLVELATGGAWAVLWYQYYYNQEDVIRFFGFALAVSVLIAIFLIDLELYLIPEQLNAALLFIGLGINFALILVSDPSAFQFGLPSAIVGALGGLFTLWLITFIGRVLFGKDAMGHGDIKMARGIGAVLFLWAALVSFGLAVLLGAVLGALQVAFSLKSKPADPADFNRLEGPEENEPESLRSLLWCGLGYLLVIDVIGQFYRPLYKWWFGEDPFEPPEDLETFQAERTVIPFGPYLALSALLVILFQEQIFGLLDMYAQWAGLTREHGLGTPNGL
jgi:leader peptidase (prepilin peptidase)/N-methyltransferase